MKKKISLLGLILILVLSFTGCGKSETTEYDQTTMEQYADTIISAFSSMSEEDMDYYENLRDLNLDITLFTGTVTDRWIGFPDYDRKLEGFSGRMWRLY